MQYSFSHHRLAAAFGSLALLSSPLLAASADTSKSTVPVASPSIWEKPVWLTDLSLRVGESYDTNIYLASIDLPPGDHVAVKDKASAITTISPKIGADFAKLLGSDSILKTFAVGYAPDIALFHNAPDETNVTHRFTTLLKGKADAVSFSLDNTFTFINGDSEGLFYPADKSYSSFVNGTVRERRQQWQERTKASVTYELGSFFIRPTGSLLYYDLATDLKPSASYNSNLYSYTNYVDRYDVNGGADLGYKLNKGLALTAGYRYGHQEQGLVPGSPITANNDYQRALVGVEGSPFKWLKVEAVAGPQFTTYSDSRQYVAETKAKGLIDKNRDDIYAEASATITPTSVDTLVLKYKRWNWVSSTGKNATLETSYDASYRHQFTKKLALELGLRAAQADYHPSALRNDWDYVSSVGLKYAVTKNLGLDAAYAYDRGNNDQPATTYRDYKRSIVSSGVTWKF